ncbi:type I DNA topoisomerase [Mycoplasma bradburyae]|uniref:DNA topoisomerase 1 n=1 Tax=Mycoplasma bradburyae TaxID=2963128 RepID=A0AAW6HR83_9MOLU|nr:type I DNA topoisomerase [Mycoplasma bradburyae]MDC4163580.1 type I DNA topoisomerase [Mycoplasma bradburyae]MDC4182177.1 type I DNA topoisomerase [Mycoplasma bradburyae]MDC4183683.1 type I DNA topoisomerase [Mycoplasma bradburyae]MDC4184364.1 type I DNA topoisomerase [Mycoplasma bradburyae]UTS70003.1 type I DNA topoisomerase [Mycoplasma bradburyae]
MANECSKILIIESPNKIKTLKKYLSDEYDIVATVGHIRDLPKYTLGFNTEDFVPKWEIIQEKKTKTTTKDKKSKTAKKVTKKELINELVDKAKKADEIYLATDPDREGEAISWHVYDVLKDRGVNVDKCKRIVFNEISEKAVKNALANPREIQKDWVASQITRRRIDRLIGFKLSSLLKSKLNADSAGRVQSIALKFITEREDLIKKFVPRFWWTLDVVLKDGTELMLRKIDDELKSKLSFKELEEVSGIDFNSKEDAEIVKQHLGDKYKVYAVDEPKLKHSYPKDVYKTSTLQQDAINKLKWRSMKITSVAQELYEGVSVDNEQIALISYPRTDSTRLSPEYRKTVVDFITKSYGDNYVAKAENDISNRETKKAKKEKVKAQDAHEAIHPIDITITPQSLKGKISNDQYSLYKLIWTRTVARYMAPAAYELINIRLINNNNKFYAVNNVLKFDGYKKIYSHFNDTDHQREIKLEQFEIGKEFEASEVMINEHQTQPTPRYTQATLIESLESEGIGRPSTYSTILDIVLKRNYAELTNGRYYKTTDLGTKVASELDKNFPTIINKEFTRNMEATLDEIAHGSIDDVTYLKSFWSNFSEVLNEAKTNIIKQIEYVEGRNCPECDSRLVKRQGRFGSFIGCSNYPKCKHIDKTDQKPKVIIYEEGVECDLCHSKMIRRKSYKKKNNNEFLGCSNFPKCKFTKNIDSGTESDTIRDSTIN